jgi:DNA-binding CsgD family transcriptional regulator
LAASGVNAAVRQAHAAHFVAGSEAAAGGLVPPDHPQWVRRVEADIANIRAALDWLRSCGRIADALRLMINLSRFWLQPTHVLEGRS